MTSKHVDVLRYLQLTLRNHCFTQYNLSSHRCTVHIHGFKSLGENDWKTEIKKRMKLERRQKVTYTLSFCCILTVARLLLSFFMSRTTSNSSRTPALSTSALSNTSCSHVQHSLHQGQQPSLNTFIITINYLPCHAYSHLIAEGWRQWIHMPFLLVIFYTLGSKDPEG